MIIYIVIPTHNEEDTLGLTLESLTTQTVLPKKVVVVNDNSTDGSLDIMHRFSQKYDWISTINIVSSTDHLPGSKVIKAFNYGLETLDNDYDIVCKFDADVVFPENYLDSIISIFKSDEGIGVAGGLPFIKKKNKWIFEAIASQDHVRGPIKAYRKGCFDAIGGLKPSIGWDSVDVLLAQYYGWKVKTDRSLHVKHLKPTGKTYHGDARYLQGEALYKMRFGFLLSTISSIKGAIKRKQPRFFLNGIKGFFDAKRQNVSFIVTEAQGKFIRKLRWTNILRKLI